jgi:hypothetical protein
VAELSRFSKNEQGCQYFRAPSCDFSTSSLQFFFDFTRRITTYNEAGFTLNLFANGSEHGVPLDSAISFFKVGRFPPNFFRRPTPFTLHDVGQANQEIMAPYPVPTGYNKYGRFIFTSISSTTVSLFILLTLYKISNSRAGSKLRRFGSVVFNCAYVVIYRQHLFVARQRQDAGRSYASSVPELLPAWSAWGAIWSLVELLVTVRFLKDTPTVWIAVCGCVCMPVVASVEGKSPFIYQESQTMRGFEL